MLTSAISTIGYYLLAIVLGIAANVLTPLVAGRLGNARVSRLREDVVVHRAVLADGLAADDLVVLVGINVIRFVGGATLVVLGAIFTAIGVVFLTHHVPVGFTIPGIQSVTVFLAGIAQGAGFAVVFLGSYLMTKGFYDMMRLKGMPRDGAGV